MESLGKAIGNYGARLEHNQFDPDLAHNRGYREGDEDVLRVFPPKQTLILPPSRLGVGRSDWLGALRGKAIDNAFDCHHSPRRELRTGVLW